MHREGVELVGVDPGDRAALGAGPSLAPDQPTPEGDRELLADLAVVIRDDVAGVGVDAGQGEDLDVIPGLFLDLADDGAGDRLTDLVAAAGEGPQVVVGAVDEQDTAPVVLDGTTLVAAGAPGSSK